MHTNLVGKLKLKIGFYLIKFALLLMSGKKQLMEATFLCVMDYSLWWIIVTYCICHCKCKCNCCCCRYQYIISQLLFYLTINYPLFHCFYPHIMTSKVHFTQQVNYITNKSYSGMLVMMDSCFFPCTITSPKMSSIKFFFLPG